MDGGDASLKLVLDRNLGSRVLEFIRLSEVCPADQVTSLEEMGYPDNMDDEVWMADLGAKGGHIAVTRDCNILDPAVRRDAWAKAKLGLIMLDSRWGSLKRRAWPRHLLYWWPIMTQRALQGPRGPSYVRCHLLHKDGSSR